ncbi:MAG TPA: hypothetical protein VD768_08760 [Sphingomicrobium sp.]|nr:hypothetical protein [Sphingomicrobium sp.]
MAEAAHTPGPLRVEQDETWPYRIRIVTEAGDVVESYDRIASSTAQNSLADCLNAVGFKEAEAPAVRDMLSRQLADAHLRAAAPDLLEAAENAREIIGNLLERHSETLIGEAHAQMMQLLAALARARGAAS